MVHFHKHLHSAVSFYSISFCNTNTYTIFFRSRIRLYCISFEVNFYSVCRNVFRFQCFSNILGTSLGQLKVYCCITCIYICITCYANLCRRIFLQILNQRANFLLLLILNTSRVQSEENILLHRFYNYFVFLRLRLLHYRNRFRTLLHCRNRNRLFGFIRNRSHLPGAFS